LTPLEALADSIMQFEGWAKASRSWRNRNPGNLRPTSADQPQIDGYRVFPSLVQGFAALRDDLSSKFDGSHGLTPASTLLDLLSVYAPAGDKNSPNAYTQFVCAWTGNALGRVIQPTMELGEYIQFGAAV
jgi:hypothetical protein